MTAKRAALISSIVAYAPNELYWALTNHNEWSISFTAQLSWSSANYQAGLAAVLDGVHAGLPSCKIYLQSTVPDLVYETCAGTNLVPNFWNDRRQ